MAIVFVFGSNFATGKI